MNILHIISSPKQKLSSSFKLSNTIVNQLLEKHPEATIEEMFPRVFPHADGDFIANYAIPKEQQSEEQKEILKLSDSALEQLHRADTIVIALPMYNFGIPSSLKAWIDQIVRPGISFAYDENGLRGLIPNKKVYLAISSGTVFSDGSSQFEDHAESYLKTVLRFIGITDVTVFRAEGMNHPAFMETALEKAIESVQI